MGKRKKEKEKEINQEIELIPLVEEVPQEETEIDADYVQDEHIENEYAEEQDSIPITQTKTVESDASELFGTYVTEENKWERRNRIREEKEKKRAAKKRAKYKDVDDETYEGMKARPGHILFGVICIIMLFVGIGLSVAGIYRLAINPAYAKVGEAEINLQVQGIATDGDADSNGHITVLQGIATPSDLVDTWEEQKFATPSDSNATTQTDEPSESE